MTARDAESWARLRLVEGDSSAKKWELVSSLGHTTLTVGSGSDCTWVVRAEEVRPVHFSLHWDGHRLRAADVYSAGGVKIDGVELTSQWRPMSGRARIEFGKAAMVVETSPPPSDRPPNSSEQSLEPSHGGPNTSSSVPGVLETRPVNSQQRNIGKGTLIGVAPQTLLEAKMLENYSPPSVVSELPEGVSAKDARRAERAKAEREKVERDRANPSMKATLVGGLGFGPMPTPLSTRAAEAPAPPSSDKAPSSRPASPSANATLMGFNVAEVARAIVSAKPVPVGDNVPVVEAELVEPEPLEQKSPSSKPPSITLGPAPSRRMTQKGVVSAPPEPAQAVHIQPAPASAERTERIGSAWQELPEDPRAGRTLRGVQEIEEDYQRPPRLGAASEWGGREERFSDAPTQMRDPMGYDKPRPTRGFPWRYVGVLALTGVAYFAWLYLLDHM